MIERLKNVQKGAVFALFSAFFELFYRIFWDGFKSVLDYPIWDLLHFLTKENSFIQYLV